jgi:UDP-N-acetylglucosamine 2-epimerase (non-hydrolysing)
MHVTHVVGARPNFMKVAPVMRALGSKAGITQRLVHTGQHYDPTLSDVFFADLELPQPDLFLGVGSLPHGAQTAAVLQRFEELLLSGDHTDLVVVVGDVNSSLAAALAASKLRIPVAHVEAGLRSYDRDMPEELNRVCVDHLSDLLLTPSADADANLAREGIPEARVHLVGNVMIDTLIRELPRARHSGILDALRLVPREYSVLTLHRPSNVDDGPTLRRLLSALAPLAKERPMIFPVHPRTRKRLAEFGLEVPEGLRLEEPMGYLDFLRLTDAAALVLTDSGGLQEETTVLGVPCLTLRENTERPITVAQGTNTVVGLSEELIVSHGQLALRGRGKQGSNPPLWDGHAAERIADVFLAQRSR